MGGVRTLTFAPPSGTARATVLHFHGGGFRMGAPEVLAPYAAALAARCAVEVVCPAYRLAPEHPFPAALNDSWAVVSALRIAREGRLIVAGDSAGGGVAASLTALMVEAGDAPDGLVLLSPWLDLTVSSPTYETNAATDPAFSRAAALLGRDAYLLDGARDDPRASPLFAPLARFPRTFISIGDGEVLADDGRRFACALKDKGVHVTLGVQPGMEHAAVTRSLSMAGAPETFAGLSAFVDALLAAPSAAVA